MTIYVGVIISTVFIFSSSPISDTLCESPSAMWLQTDKPLRFAAVNAYTTATAFYPDQSGHCYVAAHAHRTLDGGGTWMALFDNASRCRRGGHCSFAALNPPMLNG